MAMQNAADCALNYMSSERFKRLKELENKRQALALSIIIPAFNEEKRLPRTLERIHAYLTARAYAAEILVVDDGSCDRTVTLVEERRRNYPELRLISNG